MIINIKKKCDELFIAIAKLLEGTDNQLIFLNDLPEDSNESFKRAEKIY